MRYFIAKLVISLSLVLLTLYGYSQEKAVQVEIGAIKTELKQNAINLGLKYIKSADSLFKIQDVFFAQGNSLFQLTPQFNIKTGSGDAFSSITAKLAGIFMTFRDTTIAGQLTPNTARGFQTFPLSAGLETNNKFNTINGIVEVGWVPWYQTAGNNRTPKILKHTKLGLFMQAGYKFSIDSTGNSAVGGETDQSKEKPDNAILRTKGSLGIDTQTLFEISVVGVGLAGNADGWYDFLNGQIYYSVQGRLRFYLSQNKDKFFDFNYQKGSGAPNFNTGDQFGMGLTVTF